VLGTRILTAVVLAAVFIGALFFAPRQGWLAFCALALAAAAWEWARLSRLGRGGAIVFTALTLAAMLAATLSPPVSWTGLLHGIALAFWMIGVPLWLWRRPRSPHALALALVGLVILAAAFAALIQLRDASPALVLAVMVVVWLSDSAAFFTGRRFGRRKLAPAISPGKSWEGAYGAIVAVAIYGALWRYFPDPAVPPVAEPKLVWLVGLCIAFAVLGILGDLFESQMKRDAGVKDSGRVLPGHGGVLDRIDALLPVLPAAAWMFAR
jgi:phosphatidate cytidylyltransferase